MPKKIRPNLFNKEMFWTLLFQTGTLVGGILLIKLLAYVLTKEEYGYYALITSASALILMLPFTALLQGINRYVSIYQKANQFKEFSSNTFLLFLTLVVFYILIAVLVSSFIALDTIWDKNLLWILLFIISEIFKVYFRTVNNANRERRNIAIGVCLEFLGKLTIIFLAFNLSCISLTIVLFALFAGNTFAVALMYYRNKTFISIKQFRLRSFRVHIIRIWKYSYPLLIWAIFGWLRDMSNRWYLDIFMEKEQVALFAMMSSLALVAPTALQGIIGSFFLPIIYQKENNEKGFTRKFLKNSIPIIASIFLVSFAFVYFFKDFIVAILTDSKYLTAAWMLPWMFLTYSLYIIAVISTYEIFAQKQTKKLIISSITPGIISLIGGYFFIEKLGLEGALLNYIITYTSYFLLTLYVVIKFQKENDYN